MFWIILSFFAGFFFALSLVALFVIYQGIKGLEEAHRDGYDVPL
jgi:hypothetical protein